MQKSIFITVLLTLLFSGCSRKEEKKRVINHIPKSEIISSLDFTKYSKKGFLITPSDYGSNYDALGMFTFNIYPEANLESKTEIYEDEDDNGDIKEKERTIFFWEQDKIKAQEILDFAYKTAIKKGADAITHFKIKNVVKVVDDGIDTVILNGLEVEGLLIKRKIF